LNPLLRARRGEYQCEREGEGKDPAFREARLIIVLPLSSDLLTRLREAGKQVNGSGRVRVS